MNYNDQLTDTTLHTIGVTLILLQMLEFTVNEHQGSPSPPGWWKNGRAARSPQSGHSPLHQARGS